MPPTIVSGELALPWREDAGSACGRSQWGADLGMLRMSDPRLADESEVEPIVCVSVFVRVCGAVRLLSRARFRLQHAAASAS